MSFEGFLVAARAFQLEQTSYYEPVEQFLTQRFNSFINITTMPQGSTIESYLEEIIVQTENSILNKTGLVETFGPVFPTLSGIITAQDAISLNAEILTLSQISRNISLIELNELTLFVYPGVAYAAYSAGIYYFLNNVIQLHNQILEFDISTCESNDATIELGLGCKTLLHHD